MCGARNTSRRDISFGNDCDGKHQFSAIDAANLCVGKRRRRRDLEGLVRRDAFIDLHKAWAAAPGFCGWQHDGCAASPLLSDGSNKARRSVAAGYGLAMLKELRSRSAGSVLRSIGVGCGGGLHKL